MYLWSPAGVTLAVMREADPFTNDWAVEAVVRADTDTTYAMVAGWVGWHTGLVQTSADWSFHMSCNPYNQKVQAPGEVRPGAVQHLVGAWRAADKQMLLWVDGRLAAQGTYGGSCVTTGSRFTVGGDQYGSGSGTVSFDGVIDEVVFWDRVPTDEEVRLRAAQRR